MISLISFKWVRVLPHRIVFSPALVICLLMLLNGCASSFKAQTTVFHQWPNHTSSPLGFKFASVSAAEQTLEREAYLNVVRQGLLAKGFYETADAALAVTISYSATETRRLVPGDPGLRPSIWAGGVFRSGGIILGGSVPIGGTQAQEAFFLERALTLVLTESVNGGAKRLYEGRATSVDSGRDALAALPYLLRALLEDFPGPSGSTRDVTLPFSR
jgi:hypothetical protein